MGEGRPERLLHAGDTEMRLTRPVFPILDPQQAFLIDYNSPSWEPRRSPRTIVDAAPQPLPIHAPRPEQVSRVCLDPRKSFQEQAGSEENFLKKEAALWPATFRYFSIIRDPKTYPALPTWTLGAAPWRRTSPGEGE